MFPGAGVYCSTAPFDSGVIWLSDFNAAGVGLFTAGDSKEDSGRGRVRTGGLLGKQHDDVSFFIVSFYCPKSTENRTAMIVTHVNCSVSVNYCHDKGKSRPRRSLALALYIVPL